MAAARKNVTITGPRTTAAILARMIPARENFLIVGPPGCGKTEVVKAVTQSLIWEKKDGGDDLPYDIVVMHPVVSDPTDFKGLPGFTPGEEGETKADFFALGDLRRLVEAKRPTLCFLDDLGQAPPMVQAAAMQLLLARHVGEHKVSEFVSFGAATNDKSDNAGVSGILEPVKSRFATILHMRTNKDDWLHWALTPDEDGLPHMPPELTSFVGFRPDLLTSFEPKKTIENVPCPRTVAAAGRLMKIWGISGVGWKSGEREKLNLKKNPELRLAIEGAIGPGATAELAAYLEIWMDLPDPKVALANPDKVTIPRTQDGQHARLYALAASLSAAVDTTTAENFMVLVNKMDKEFQVFAVTSAILRNQSALLGTKPIMKWMTKNSDVIL